MTDHDRTDTIPLHASYARCEPTDTCHVKGRCARYQAALPRHGAKMEDYSIQSCGGTALCPGYLDSAAVRKAAGSVAPVVRPAKPAVRGIA